LLFCPLYLQRGVCGGEQPPSRAHTSSLPTQNKQTGCPIDIRVLIGNDSLLQRGVSKQFEQYNTEQFTAVDMPGQSYKVPCPLFRGAPLPLLPAAVFLPFSLPTLLTISFSSWNPENR
jgi:hypothetical protein